METIWTLPAWQAFLSLGILLSVAEIFVPGFILLPIGIGLVLTAPVAFFSSSLLTQLIALAVFEVAVFVLLRRYAPTSLKPAIYSGVEGMVGQECEVVEEVSPSKSGYIKLYGDRWQAKTFSGTFPVGSRAIITKLDGNKVFIEPLDFVGGKS